MGSTRDNLVGVGSPDGFLDSLNLAYTRSYESYDYRNHQG